MLEFFQFATSGVWVFVGTVIILGLMLKFAAVVILGIAAIFSRRDGKINIS